MTIKEIREQISRLGYSCEQIAVKTGLPLKDVQGILEGGIDLPQHDISYDTLNLLGKMLMDETVSGIKEAEADFIIGKKQGEYTLEDYYAVSEERRVELIDGVFYDMASPIHIHQIISGQIYRILFDYIDKNKGMCVPAIAPLDVQLDCDDRTMVQPDVMVVCDRDKFVRGAVYGAPDMVVEVLSKSTWKKDSYKKLDKYADAGVREYWLVDPDKKKVIVYDLEHDEWPAIYGFDDEVPVRIFDGLCKVDFAAIYSYIGFLYDKR